MSGRELDRDELEMLRDGVDPQLFWNPVIPLPGEPEYRPWLDLQHAREDASAPAEREAEAGA
jgi:hypothetical protein